MSDLPTNSKPQMQLCEWTELDLMCCPFCRIAPEGVSFSRPQTGPIIGGWQSVSPHSTMRSICAA
jgi:hypothetical protein